MKFTNKQMAESVMERIELTQLHIRAVEDAAHFAAKGRFGQEADRGPLWELLIRQELDEWRNLFMWSITLDDAERDRIKAAAYDRFLKKGMSVSHWLSDDGRTPGHWLVADEEEFREMARKAFAPKE